MKASKRINECQRAIMSTKVFSGAAASLLKRPKLRFHIHEPVLFDFPQQTSIINKVVLKSEATKLIPHLQRNSLEKSFHNVMIDSIEDAQDDNDVKSLYRKVYKPFLKDYELGKYFTNAAIVNQIRSYLSSNLKLRDDCSGFLQSIANDNDSSFGILRSDYLKTVGVMDQHYDNLLYHVGKRSNVLLKCHFSKPLSPLMNAQNEFTINDYLKGQCRLRSTDYFLINSPTQAESLTTLAFKLSMKVVLITEPYFERPTSMLTGAIERYDVARVANDLNECELIKHQLSEMNQITVKNLNEFQKFIQIVHHGECEKRLSLDETSFWGKLQQMELSILGELESKIYEPSRKAY